MPTKTLTPEEARLEKNKQIAKTIKETKVRRKEMICKTYSLKFSKTRISKKAWDDLNQVFKEGKWLYNEILASEDIFSYDTKGKKTVQVFNPITKEYEERRLEHLGSQVMQGIYSELKQNVVNLSKAKKKGIKVGALRFKSETNSIPLKQVDLTFKFKPNSNFRQVRIQGLKNWYYVRGGKQLNGKEIASAKLVRNGCGLYLNVTVFEEKPSCEGKTEYLREEDGIDFGLGKQITNTVGEVIDPVVEESDRLKRLQKKLARQNKGSHSYWRTKMLIRKECQKHLNQKDDLANKTVHRLMSEAKTLYFQDDNIKSWASKKGKAKGGKKVQHGILGRVKNKLENHPRAIMVGRFAPTTKTCSNCGHLNPPLDLNKRTFHCEKCGFSIDRDVNAARNMPKMADHTPVGRGEVRVES